MVNKELKKVKKWLDTNKLALNIDKTPFVIFHSHQNYLNKTVNIKIGKQHVKQDKYIKFLGLLFDALVSLYYSLFAAFLQYNLLSGDLFTIPIPNKYILCKRKLLDPFYF